MDIPKNIWFNPALNARRKTGTLTLADQVLIGVASVAAGLFPASRTDIGSRPSGVHPPEIIVNLYQQSNAKRLADTDEFTFGVDIAYIAKDPTDKAELNDAIFRVLQNLDIVQSGVGTFRCKDKNSNITDGVGHVTANISVWEQAAPTDEEAPVIQQADPIVQKAETEVKT